MTRPFFTRERISDFDIYDKNCVSTLQIARTRLEEGYPVEFQVIKVYFLMNQTLILEAPIIGPSFSVHLRFCYWVLVWTRCWIIVGEHTLSSIGSTSKQIFILQPSLCHICESIHRRTKSYCCPHRLWQWLASNWILVRQSGSVPKGYWQFYGAVDGGSPRKEESWVI